MATASLPRSFEANGTGHAEGGAGDRLLPGDERERPDWQGLEHRANDLQLAAVVSRRAHRKSARDPRATMRKSRAHLDAPGADLLTYLMLRILN